MKKILIIILVAYSISLIAQTRNTLWLDGLGTTSLGWESTPQELKNSYDYDLFNIISLQGLDETAYQQELGVEGASDHLNNLIGPYSNILGLGHDFGGLVLRNMASGNNNLTAIVLDGTPNQGSKAISFAIDDGGSEGTSKAQRIIEGVKAIKKGDDCSDCGFVDNFERWINEMKNGTVGFYEMTTNSPIINSLNQPSNLPKVPYAVFWGSMKNQSLASLMSSWYFPETGNQEKFTNCYSEVLRRARKKAKDAYIISTISNTHGVFNKAITFLSNLLANADPGNPLTIIESVNTYIKESKNLILTRIQAINAKDKELGRILRCELANQILATEWQLAMVKNGNFTTEIVDDVPSYNDCWNYCMGDGSGNGEGNPSGDKYEAWYDCIPDCMDNVTEIEVLVPEESDGLLTKSEQLLDGDEKTYHLSNTDHFQETKIGYDVLADHIQDLFNGGAGAAFLVNKK